MSEPIFNVLDPNDALKKRLFLEASAGTGKTFTIEHYVLRLMIEKGLNIDEILIVTFTNKATKELLSRVEMLIACAISKLKQVEIGCTLSLDDMPYLDNVRDPENVRRHLELNASRFDKAEIMTLHAFAYSALKKCDLASHILKNDPLPKEFISEVVSAERASGLYNPFHIEKLRRRYKTAEDFIAQIERISLSSRKIQTTPAYRDLLYQIQRCLSRVPKPSSLDELKSELKELGKQYKGILSRDGRLKKELAFSVEQLFVLLQKKEISLEDIGLLTAAMEPVLKALTSSNRKKKVKEEVTVKGFLEEFIGAYAELQPYFFDPDVTLYQLARALNQRKNEIGLLYSPDDYLYRLEELLLDPSSKALVASRFSASYKAVIIDEFQDTDPTQWTIFSELFFSKDSLEYGLVVGDPKQSIYGFRKADIYTFFSAKKAFSVDSYYRLSTNYRSDPKLTKTLNKLFSLREDGTFLWLPRIDKTVPFTPSKSPESKEVDFLSKPVKACLCDKSPDLKSQESALFPAVYREVIALKRSGLPYHEIAILVSDRYQMQAISDFLSYFKLPLLCHRDLPLKEREDWRLLKWMLEALYSDSTKSQMKAALFFEKSSEDLLANDYPKRIAEAFNGAKKHLETDGLLAALLKFKLNHWLSPSMFKLAEDFEMFRSQKGFFGWEIFHAIEAFEEDYKDEKEEIEGHIQIMTIHKSKGLEFSAVIGLGLVQPSRGLGNSLEIENELRLKSLSAENDIKAEENELDAEKLRAFYVCLTRAKNSLFIPIMTGEKIVQGKASMNTAFFSRVLGETAYDGNQLADKLKKIGVEVIFADSFMSGNMPEVELLSPAKLEPYTGSRLPFDLSSLQSTLELEAPALSYSSLHRKSSASLESVIETAQSNEPKGPEIGTYLHEVLRYLLERGLHRELTVDIFERAARCVVPKGQLDEHRDLFYSWTLKALTTPFPEIGPISNIPWEDLAVEQPFYLKMGGKGSLKIQGVIDLVVHKAGKIYIVDWKSNALLDYDTAHLEHAMDAFGYYLQASFYAFAASKIVWPWKGVSFEKAIYFFVRGKSPVVFQPELLDQKTVQVAKMERELCL